MTILVFFYQMCHITVVEFVISLFIYELFMLLFLSFLHILCPVDVSLSNYFVFVQSC